MAPDPAEQIALFRCRVIAEVLSDRLSAAERGLLVRELAARAHELPDGSRREFSRATLDRWIRAYRESELAGLYPKLRSDSGAVRKQLGHPLAGRAGGDAAEVHLAAGDLDEEGLMLWRQSIAGEA